MTKEEQLSFCKKFNALKKLGSSVFPISHQEKGLGVSVAFDNWKTYSLFYDFYEVPQLVSLLETASAVNNRLISFDPEGK